MNIKIKDKNGITLKTKDKFVKEDINVLVDENILGGAGASIKSGWQGTIVPNSGYVEKVYLNTNLSVEEVISCIENANLTYDEDGFYFLLRGETPNTFISVVNTSGMYGIMDFVSQMVYFTSADIGAGFIGWNTNFNGVINIEENLDALPTTENDKLTSLFSTTPFEPKQIQLEGEYNGSPVEITDLSGEWQGTAIPTSGLIENFYFNSNLSHDEVAEICKSLNYVEYEDVEVCPIISNMDMTNMLMIGKFYDDDLKMNYYVSMFLFRELEGVLFMVADLKYNDIPDENKGDFGVVPLPFNAPVYINIDNALSTMAPMFNFTPQNEQISHLLSTTPFTKSEPNIINVEKYIDDKKIPLKFRVNVKHSCESTLKKLLDYAQSCYYMFYYNNRLIDLTGYIQYDDTENVTDMSYMFYHCGKLTTIPRLNTRNVYIMSSMFCYCENLTKIDISHYYIPAIEFINNWCTQCYSLKAIIIRSFGSSYVLNGNAFTKCYHFTGTVNSTYNPNGDKDGYIYVPRNMVNTLKSTTNWSTYADQIRALEDYTIDGTTTGDLDETKI